MTQTALARFQRYACEMVKTVKTSNLCNLSAEEFWALRMDRNFDVFCGARDPP